MPIIKEIIIRDIRFPTSLEGHGSDAMVRVQFILRKLVQGLLTTLFIFIRINGILNKLRFINKAVKTSTHLEPTCKDFPGMGN